MLHQVNSSRVKVVKCAEINEPGTGVTDVFRHGKLDDGGPGCVHAALL